MYCITSNYPYIKTNRSHLHEDSYYWFIVLADGTHIYEDPSNINSWKQAKIFIEEQNLHIVSVSLAFRSHIEKVAENSRGFFLKKGCIASPGAFSDCYIVGTIKRNNLDSIHCHRWMMPEILLTDDSLFYLDSYRQTNENLEYVIWNDKK
jgi:hypothetical protein